MSHYNLILYLGLFTIEVPKKGEKIQGLLWGYLLQITFT